MMNQLMKKYILKKDYKVLLLNLKVKFDLDVQDWCRPNIKKNKIILIITTLICNYFFLLVCFLLPQYNFQFREPQKNILVHKR